TLPPTTTTNTPRPTSTITGTAATPSTHKAAPPMSTIDNPAATLALLQLHDSGYPAGRFVHSNGLESWLGAHPAAREHEIAEVGRSFVLDTVAGLDAVAMAHVWRRDGLEELLELDRYVSAHKLSASARTASTSC